MKIVGIMPIKLNNERLPGKNTKFLADKPLLQYELLTLQKTGLVDDIYVYCSDTAVCDFLPRGIQFIKRSKKLDLPTSNFTQIFQAFMNEVDADIYVYAHATAPFISIETMKQCIEAVKTVSDLYIPVSGEVLEFNSALEDQPDLVNKDPYGEGWIIKMKVDDEAQLDGLLSADAYKATI